ncbi:MAG: hypothetical protein WAM09_14835 [Anaerolineales bacterium]
MSINRRLTLTGDFGKFLHAQGGRDPSTPSQAPQLDPGRQDCWGQLWVEDHSGWDENPTRRQQGLGHYITGGVVSCMKNATFTSLS